MALSDDQKAMLRLLAQREEGYEDIAALMGLTVEEVRAKVREALSELDAAPAGAAAPQPAPPQQPPAPEPAPVAAPPPAREKPPRAEKPARVRKPPRSRTGGPGVTWPRLPKDQGALRGLLAGGAVVLVIVILLVTGVFGGGDEDGSGSGGSSGGATSAGSGGGEPLTGEGGTPTIGGKQPTQAVLKPVGGGDASGQALFGRSGKNVVLLLAARGLEPSPPGQSYTVSLVRSPSERLPVIVTEAGKQGIISGSFRVEAAVLGLLASGFDEMEISLVPNDELRTALAQAKQDRKAAEYGGEPVLAGPVTGPIVEAGG
jgi:hypothetical protein